MVEPRGRITARHGAEVLPWGLGIPLKLGVDIASIEGRERVERVVLTSGEVLEADGVIVTGRFRPEAVLVRESHLAFDQATGGPEVDEYGRTSDPCVFAAGNVLRPVETAGWCWEEGRAVAGAMARALRGRVAGGAGPGGAGGRRDLGRAAADRGRGRRRRSTGCRCGRRGGAVVARACGGMRWRGGA